MGPRRAVVRQSRRHLLAISSTMSVATRNPFAILDGQSFFLLLPLIPHPPPQRTTLVPPPPLPPPHPIFPPSSPLPPQSAPGAAPPHVAADTTSVVVHAKTLIAILLPPRIPLSPQMPNRDGVRPFPLSFPPLLILPHSRWRAQRGAWQRPRQQPRQRPPL